MPFELGDILVFDGDGSPCVVVGLSGQILDGDEVPEEHIAVWFGDSRKKSEAEQAQDAIEVWTIPEEYFKSGPEPSISH